MAVIFFGLCCDGALLQDKFGESLALEKGGGGELLTGLLCEWIHPMVMILGAFLSTCGAGLQLGWQIVPKLYCRKLFDQSEKVSGNQFFAQIKVTNWCSTTFAVNRSR